MEEPKTSTPNDAKAKDRDLALNTTEAGATMNTDQGIPVSTDRNSLRAGERGPSLLEDYILREKITHFDHERIPERVVHARGAGAHGFFQVYKPLTEYSSAKFLQDPTVQTPVFVRFSTVAGSRGSADTARDVRGFAVKFYTEEGNFDLVGNNIPVFFIQDAIKFPDLIHAAKPEPHHEIPQASTAHDTFWDFISLTPESMHMIMWVMSDRGIPRSYRMMDGFGVHTFRLVNAQGESHYVKFHWKPILGAHSLVWDEALKLAGKDPDFHRRDLWEAIDGGNYPEYEFGLQIIAEGEEAKFDFDILDATKIWPEDLVPVQRVGKLTLNRNPDNYFAETEQVAFHSANIVPGIDFTNDPLLQGRLFSYLDTQLLRLGGPNFAEIPINRPIVPVSNNQRDGHMRQTINKGRTSYEPNSLNGNRPDANPAGFVSYPAQTEGTKVRVRAESFGDHYGQAKLFWNSMTEVEREHIIGALQFELSKVETREIRLRMLDHLAKINPTLHTQVAMALGEIKTKASDPQPKNLPKAVASSNGVTAESNTTASGGLDRTAGLSLEENPKTTIKSRKVAIAVADGVDTAQVNAIKAALIKAGALPQIVAPHIGEVTGADGKSTLAVDKTYANSGSVVFDAVFVPGGAQSIATLLPQEPVRHFIFEAYKHGKAIAAVGEGLDLLAASQLDGLPQHDAKKLVPLANTKGVVTAGDASDLKGIGEQFIEAIKQHRHWNRMPQQEFLPE